MAEFYNNEVILLPHGGRPQEVPSKGADHRRGFNLPLGDAASEHRRSGRIGAVAV